MDSPMEAKMDKIEQRLATLEIDVSVIRTNYATKADIATLESTVSVIRSNYATKADIATLESKRVKWFIGTAVTLAGLAFAVARYVH